MRNAMALNHQIPNEDQLQNSGETRGLGRQIATGGAWMMLFKLTEKTISLVSITILARILMPEDFGVVAMAMSLIATLELLSAFSFDMALIQNQAAERRHYDTAWTFNLIFAVIGAALMLLGASAAADFYSEDRLVDVARVLAFTFLIQGLENIGTVDFRKRMQFNREFTFLLAKKLTAVLVTVPLAFLWRNYWALVVGMLSGRIVGVALSYVMHPYRPRPSLAARSELFRFSGWLLANNLIFFAKNRIVEFMIGRMLGPQTLGTYTVAAEISNLPTTELIAPINRAVYPGYAKLAADSGRLRPSFLSIFGMIAMLAIPAGVGVSAVAEPVVRVLLGEKWLPATPVINVLAFFGALSAMQSNTTYVFLAIGKPRIETLLGIVYVVILILLLATLAPNNGIIGAARAYLLTVIIITPITLFLVAYHLELRLRELAGVLWRPAVAAAAMYAVVRLSLNSISARWPDCPTLLLLLSVVALGALTYVAIVLGLWTLSGRETGTAEANILNELEMRLRQ